MIEQLVNWWTNIDWQITGAVATLFLAIAAFITIIVTVCISLITQKNYRNEQRLSRVPYFELSFQNSRFDSDAIRAEANLTNIGFGPAFNIHLLTSQDNRLIPMIQSTPASPSILGSNGHQQFTLSWPPSPRVGGFQTNNNSEVEITIRSYSVDNLKVIQTFTFSVVQDHAMYILSNPILKKIIIPSVTKSCFNPRK